MSKSKNFYQILHVQQDAPSEVIRSTYRTIMQKLKMHPDLGGDQENAALINEAYSVLMDEHARAEYDKHLSASQNSNVRENYTEQQADHYKEPSATIFKENQCFFCELPHNHGEHAKSDSLCTRCGAALYPATMQNIELNGNRLINRVEKQWPVSFYTNWQDARGYIGMTQDVSLNGIQILSNTYIENGKVLKLSSHMLDAVAVVVNSRSDHTILRKRWRIGLEYLTLRFHQVQGTFVKIDA
ncbi:MAG: DnaJ domain-containing protein [Gammaproteobacteria bacterium]|nr:DnaJ domain-containing protein [Gammaproteobacteria bacterium]